MEPTFIPIENLELVGLWKHEPVWLARRMVTEKREYAYKIGEVYSITCPN